MLIRLIPTIATAWPEITQRGIYRIWRSCSSSVTSGVQLPVSSLLWIEPRKKCPQLARA